MSKGSKDSKDNKDNKAGKQSSGSVKCVQKGERSVTTGSERSQGRSAYRAVRVGLVVVLLCAGAIFWLVGWPVPWQISIDPTQSPVTQGTVVPSSVADLAAATAGVTYLTAPDAPEGRDSALAAPLGAGEDQNFDEDYDEHVLRPGDLAQSSPIRQGFGDWPMYGHDPSRTNFNPDETVLSPDNITQMTSRWQVDIGFGGSPTSSGPIVAGGRVYGGSSVTTGPNFYTFDAETGEIAWRASRGPSPTRFGVGIGATAAISGSAIVAGGADAAYYGLDASIGTVLWRHALDAGPSTYAGASPLILGGRACLGVASGCDNPSVRGEIRAVSLE